MSHDQLIELLEPLIKKATLLELNRVEELTDLTIDGTHFGGLPYAERGDQWPICRKCDNPLSFICQVNMGDSLHPDDRPTGLYTFFYCWECMPWGTDDQDGLWDLRSYPTPHAQRFSRIERPHDDERALKPCETTSELIATLPDWDDLSRQSEQAAALCRTLNQKNPWDAYAQAADKLVGGQFYATHIGGYPLWIQDEETPGCPQCGSVMELLMQIDSEDEAGLMWVDAGCVYLFRCESHPQECKLRLQYF